MTIKVLVVDDHAVVRQGLEIFLGMDPEIKVVGEAGDGETAIRMARELKPDIVIMDLLMPGMDGVAATRAVRRESPNTEVLVLTSALKNELVVQAIQAGAIGYLLKHTEAPRLREAVHAAAAGQVQLSPEAAVFLLQEVRVPHTVVHITERETEVLRLVARSCSNKEIGRQLNISEATVKSHVRNIMDKLGLNSRVQVALHAMQLGLIDTAPASAQ